MRGRLENERIAIVTKRLVWPSKRKFVTFILLLHEKFLQIDWLRAVVFQLNLKNLHVQITNILRVAV